MEKERNVITHGLSVLIFFHEPVLKNELVPGPGPGPVLVPVNIHEPKNVSESINLLIIRAIV